MQATLDNAPKESDYTLLRQALGNFSAAKGYLNTFAPGSSIDRTLSQRMEATLWAGLEADRANRDRARSWLGAYIDVASSDAALARLGDVLSGKNDAAGVEIDQDIRWSIIEQLNRANVAGSEALIKQELARDNSESGQLSALGATVIRPDAATKTAWLTKIQSLDNSEPYARLRAAMGAMYPGGQETLDETTAAQRLATLADIDKKADRVFMRSYAGSMIPSTCTAASVDRLAKAIDSNTTLSAGTRRSLLLAHENYVRCVAIRAAFDQSQAKR